MRIPNLDDKIEGCEHFTWREALWLPSWDRAATEDDGLTPDILANLKDTFQKLDKVRKYFNKPINVTVCIRPLKYHLELYERINSDRKKKGLTPLKVPMGSGHLSGKAVDFVIEGISCDEAEKRILKDDKLKEWGMRMEDNGNGEWIHLDTKSVGPGGRYFKP